MTLVTYLPVTISLAAVLLVPLRAWSQFNEPEQTDLVSDTTFGDWAPTISSDLLEAHFVSTRGNRNWDIWTARREHVDDPWTDQHPLEIINTLGIEGSPHLSSDGLTVTFESDGLEGGFGGRDLWQTM